MYSVPLRIQVSKSNVGQRQQQFDFTMVAAVHVGKLRISRPGSHQHAKAQPKALSPPLRDGAVAGTSR